MYNITNEKVEGVFCGESPHMVTLTADPHIFQTIEPILVGPKDIHFPDFITENDDLFFQEDILV